METTRPYCQDVEMAPVQDRLRWWAAVLQARHDQVAARRGTQCSPSPIAVTLWEAALEIDLGQRTESTFLGAGTAGTG